MRSSKKILYVLGFTCLAGVWLTSCSPAKKEGKAESDFQSIRGEAQGTTYSITYEDSTGGLFSKQEADSIFEAIDNSLSEWVDSSTISLFNRKDSMLISDPHFLKVFFRGREISDLTGGAFEPKVMPLVHAWGFGPNGAEPKGEVRIDSLMDLIHTPIEAIPVDTLSEKPKFILKKMKGQELDVNGIAQGYSVDVLGKFLDSKGIDNFMVEVGGEVLASGKNANGEYWKIGIDKPVDPDQPRQLQAVARVKNKAICTSGSYRKFYVKDGQRYSHTIDPLTGKPVDHGLISTTVMASNCMDGDTFATAFMAMGVERAKEFIDTHPELDLAVYLIYDAGDGEWETYMSPGMKEVVEVL